MKLPKIFCLLGYIVFVPIAVFGQSESLYGTWQLVKQSSCLDETASTKTDSLELLREDMHTQSSATPVIIVFKDNSTGEESTRILNSKRAANQKKFFYKFNGEMLLILDKKSQTISDSYMVDRFTADSLIVSNVSRPCETKIFRKITGDQAN
jgi:hypothetical protein